MIAKPLGLSVGRSICQSVRKGGVSNEQWSSQDPNGRRKLDWSVCVCVCCVCGVCVDAGVRV
jgi:hypothetical protein